MRSSIYAVAYLLADDTKLYKEIKREEDSEKLQNDLDSLQKWSDTWLLKLHPNKCKVMTVSSKKKREEISNQYHLYDNLGQEIELQTSEGEKDIGVLVDEQLSFSKHMQQQINKANSIMGLIRRTYIVHIFRRTEFQVHVSISSPGKTTPRICSCSMVSI